MAKTHKMITRQDTSRHLFQHVIQKRRPRQNRTLVNARTIITRQDASRQHLFQHVIQKRRPQHVAYYIFNNREPSDDIKRYGTTLLHIAVGGGSVNSVDRLVRTWNTNIDVGDKNGDTPLHIAACLDYGDIAAFLISRGANVNARNKNGETPLYTAIKYQRYNIVMYLMCQDGVDILARNNNGSTLLHIAAEGHDMDIMRLLLSKVDVNVVDNHGRTPLYSVAFNTFSDATEIATMFIKKYGASPRVIDTLGKMPVDLVEDNHILKEYLMTL
jgi:hypothetical protein